MIYSYFQIEKTELKNYLWKSRLKIVFAATYFYDIDVTTL